MIIETILELENIIKVIETKRVIYIDMEGYNLGKDDSQATLTQIGYDLDHIYLVDILVLDNISILETILNNENIIKVMWDCRSDSKSLYNEFGITLRNVLDLQIVITASLVAKNGKVKTTKLPSLKNTSKYFGFVSYNDNIVLDSYNLIENISSKWLERPICDTLTNYALQDIKFIIKIYNKVFPYLTTLELSKCKAISTDRINHWIYNNTPTSASIDFQKFGLTQPYFQDSYW